MVLVAWVRLVPHVDLKYLSHFLFLSGGSIST